ncbi:MAG: lipopolysaccharide transport periplasmic protein LptA [Gammaproteobacteria bacterium]
MLSSPNKFLCHALLLAFLALAPAATSWALPGDRQQPMYVESDSASRDDRSGVTTYIGSVRVDQGSMHIEADKVTVYMAAGGKDVDRIVCEGKPATYRQQPKPDAEIAKAHAEVIEYQVAKDFIVLTRAARLEQGGSILEGERITYDIAKDQMQARGGENNGRIRMVIPPQQPSATPTPAP